MTRAEAAADRAGELRFDVVHELGVRLQRIFRVVQAARLRIIVDRALAAEALPTKRASSSRRSGTDAVPRQKRASPPSPPCLNTSTNRLAWR